KNILVAGGTGSGKTTFVNAVVEAISRLTPEDRLVIIEDTTELQPKSENVVQMRSNSKVSMEDLLVSTLRLRPDRILVGEVRRGGPAMTLTNSWNTGHEGGVATVHANSAPEAMSRLEELITMDGFVPVKSALARAVNYVVFMRKERGVRRVTEIVEIGYDSKNNEYVFDWKYKFKTGGRNGAPDTIAA
ncbi:MAG: Flp pilus assembly complex ATPase component TadA, partial [Candidatus Adiutrix sp.]|nr:Flp pilus assembly complex ATPase component TadA [Candidatus Adiutrix sp.]